jgi:UDP-4-amino-4,6-dideoxy-N-acetyl-beta-L-altrosamine N-acetyltransferase
MISGEAISLRSFARRHLEETRLWANDPELTRLMDRARPVSDLEHEEWFAHLHEKTDRVYFAIETNEDNHHIGNVWLWDIDWRHRRAELRIVIGNKAHQKRGCGTEAISFICDYAFERLNLHKIYAYVLSINESARHAFERAGFVLEGTLREDRWVDGRYVDVYFLGKIK